MSTPPSPPPAPRRGLARPDASEAPIAWPILIIDRDDRFVHVLGERDLDMHHEGPNAPGPLAAARVTGPESDGEGEPAPTVPVDFFDRDGRRLRPIVAADFVFLGVEATAVLAPTDVLLQRLDRAVRWALTEMTDRGIEVVDTPDPPTTGNYGAYLDELERVFCAVPDDGSAWHNLIHMIT
jgi:hypothetical protein